MNDEDRAASREGRPGPGVEEAGGTAPGRPEIDVRRVAELARLTVAEEDLPGLQADLERLLAFVDELREVDVAGVEPLLRPTVVEGALREDVHEPRQGGAVLEALGGTTQDGRLEVPRTIDTDA